MLIYVNNITINMIILFSEPQIWTHYLITQNVFMGLFWKIQERGHSNH